jgi:mannose-1-phosphate guanylyltransferase
MHFLKVVIFIGTTAEMGWSDPGTWSSLYERTTIDDNENAIVCAKVFTYTIKGDLISMPPEKTALLQGLNGYIVVDTFNALLIIRKEENQKIKQYLEDIKN